MRHRNHGFVRVALGGVVLVGLGAGCSLLVSGDVPDYRCAGTDPSACPSGLTCDVVSHRCVSNAAVEEAGIVEDGAFDMEVPDVVTDGPPAGPLALGAKCRIDNDCKSKICGSSTVLTTAITSTTGPICTSPCCTSTDCPASFVCFNGGTGGGYCVPATLAKRTPAATGGTPGGFPCTNDTDCRSGLCTGSPKACLDTCCVLSDCGGATTCRFDFVSAPAPAHGIWVCKPARPTGTKEAGEVCNEPSECMSDNCIGFPTRVCGPPCSNTASCKALPNFTSGHCRYGSSGSDSFKFCLQTTTTTDLPLGSSCTDDSACQSDYCDAERKTCANVCGKDADCAASEVCRPSATNTPYLRCVPKG